jgi:histone acetyltransferase (RNA polymerase elongator complex component)
MKQNKHYNIPIFLPELACRNKCVFCNQRNISGTHHIPTIQDAQEIIETHLTTIPTSGTKQIAFFGGNFTGLPIEQQKAFLKLAQSYIHKGAVESIRISTRPDYISEDILRMLQSYGVKDIELGAQSFDNEVLALSQRGHTSEDIIRAAELIRTYHFKLGLQMMIGLPGDSYEKSMHTAQKIIDYKADTTRIYPCLVIANTVLADMYTQGRYKPLDRATATVWLADIYSLFSQHNIRILRVGLHPSKDFESSEIVLAGPYHPSIKQLALSQIWKNRFAEKIKLKKGKLHISVSAEALPYAIGYESSNKQWLRETYGWVAIHTDTHLQYDEFTYCYN